MKRNSLSQVFTWLLAGGLLIGTVGCAPWHPAAWWSTWFDPSKTIARPTENEHLPILATVDPLDEYRELVPNAETPTAADLRWTSEEYVLGPGDVIDISVLDLFSEGVESMLRRSISDAGYVDLPLLENRIILSGQTVEQARQTIVNAYKPGILKSPTVSMSVIAQRQNTFSILGAVGRPGTYNILRRQFRLMEAMALAGDVTQTNIEYIYVIRLTPEARQLGPSATTPERPVQPMTPEGLPPMPGTTAPAPSQPEAGVVQPAPAAPTPGLPGAVTPTPAMPGAGQPTSDQSLEELRQFMPSGAAQPETLPIKPSVIQLTQLLESGAAATSPTTDQAWGYQQGQGFVTTTNGATQPGTTAPASSAPAIAQEGGMPLTQPSDDQAAEAGTLAASAPASETQPGVGEILPVIRDGSEMAASNPAGQPQAPTSQPTGPEGADKFGWAQGDLSHLARIIAVNLPKLKEGDPRMNIVIRDNDIIHVPMLEVGEFYVMGEVARPGVYSLTGRRVTVKMALAAAGDTAPLAWPSNTVLIRRIGENQEVMVPLRLDLIMAGKEPDIFLKPNDVIAVGTNAAAPFLAVFRNAFRLTYGFGFIYDRNFAQRNNFDQFGQRQFVDFFGH